MVRPDGWCVCGVRARLVQSPAGSCPARCRFGLQIAQAVPSATRNSLAHAHADMCHICLPSLAQHDARCIGAHVSIHVDIHVGLRVDVFWGERREDRKTGCRQWVFGGERGVRPLAPLVKLRARQVGVAPQPRTWAFFVFFSLVKQLPCGPTTCCVCCLPREARRHALFVVC
jgi:hypothetical protein